MGSNRKGFKDDIIAKLNKKIKRLEAQIGCEPSEKNESKFYHNSWDNIVDIGKAVTTALKDKEWSWAKNTRCKYVSIRIDMRNGGAILVSRGGERISIEQLQYQYVYKPEEEDDV